MINARQLASALYGVWLLLKFDLKAWNYFDKTLPGFWASFAPALVMAPPYFVHVVHQYGLRKMELAFAPFLIVQGLAYVISWTLFPFAMMYLVQLLQRGPRYFWHMVPYNWLQLPLNVVLYVILLLVDFAGVPVAVAGYTQLAIVVIVAIYGTFIAGIGLQVVTGTALSLVVLDIVLGMLTSLLIEKI